MKTGKEIKINKFKNYNILFGSVNNRQPKAIYLNISSWLEPKSNEDINYSRVIKDINKKIKQSIYNLFENDINFTKDRTIVDLDIRESGIRYSKRSFMSCELTLFLNDDKPIFLDKMSSINESVINTIINNIFEENKFFTFHRKKK